MKKQIIILGKKIVKTVAIIIASIVVLVVALILVLFATGTINKRFGKLFLDDDTHCAENICFKTGIKGKFPVVYKSYDGKIWKETFPQRNIYIYPLIESRYSSIEINGNTVWVTEIVPAPGETSGDVCGIYYSHDLGVTWHAISNVYDLSLKETK